MGGYITAFHYVKNETVLDVVVILSLSRYKFTSVSVIHHLFTVQVEEEHTRTEEAEDK